jgi:hypothetical protein
MHGGQAHHDVGEASGASKRRGSNHACRSERLEVKVLRSKEGPVGEGTRCQPERPGTSRPKDGTAKELHASQARRWASHRKQGAKVQHELSEVVAGMR